jgi:serine protease Do
MQVFNPTYRQALIQIATPYSTGTGFYLADAGLIVTAEHVVRDNREVIVRGPKLTKQIARVLFLDERHDLAFLDLDDESPELPEISLAQDSTLAEGDPVLAMGHPFGYAFQQARGVITQAAYELDRIRFLQHDATLGPLNSGGPLFDVQGELVGVNTFQLRDGRSLGFALPVAYLRQALAEFKAAGGKPSSRCASCNQLILSEAVENDYCANCGASIQLPDRAEPYEPIGVAKTIEDLLERAGYDVRLSRRGPDTWEIHRGSARIHIAYYEKTGLITGDAYLCILPEKNLPALYEYLLRQNYETESLTLSIKGQDIILSLLIYDRYLNLDTGIPLFEHLFERADYYDNVLVENFGARWKFQNGMSL